MNDKPPEGRTFDRDDVALILRDAAQLDMPSLEPASHAVPESDGDRLTLAEIERAASAVGISSAAVTAAWLRRSLTSARDESGRIHLSHELTGELSADAYERLVGELRTLAGPATIRRTADGVEVEVGATAGRPGSLTIQIRSAAGMTTLSMWSHAPVMTRGDIAGCALLGVPAFLFPAVALAGGHWPALSYAAALASMGAVVGAGLGASAQRWRIIHWNERVERILVPVALRVSELIAMRDVGDAPRALP